MKIVLAALQGLVSLSLAAAHVYSVPEGERIYDGYAVSVDGASAPVSEVRCSAMPFNRRWPGHQRQIEQTELCGMVRFAFDGKATMSVTAARDFKEVKIRPLSRNVAFRRDGRTVTFDLVRPGGYSVEFDGYHNNLHVFADAAKAYAPPANAIVFGPGFHDIGIRELKSGDTVYLDPGAVVYGGFSAAGATNIAILGRGVLDGGKLKEKILFPASGDGHEAVKNAKRWHTVNFRNCRDVKIDGIVIRDSLLYNIGMWGCEDVAVSGVKIVGQWRFNTDGIDLHNCRRARVSDCFARTFDDTFCFKAHEGYGNCEDCVFERCVAWNDWGKAFEVGVECRAEHLRRLAFRDCDSIHAVGWAMDVTNVDYGRVSDVLFDNIRIESDEPMPAMQLQPADDSPFDPKKGLADPPSLFQGSLRFHHEYSKENGGKWSGGGFIDGVTVRNVSVTTDGRKPCIKFRQIDATHRPENVVFEDLSVNGKPVANASDLVLELPEGMPPPQFKISDDAKRMGAEMMNPGKTLSCIERKGGGSFKVLIYGNSIAFHGIAPKIGWTNLWGMAASAREKDFAHLVVAGLEARRGGRADFRIRNLAMIERNITARLADFVDLADDVAYAPDYVVIAIGENVPSLDATGADDYRRLLVSLAKPLAGSAKHPPVVLRSPFWKNSVKAKCTALAAAEVGAAYVDAGPLGDNPENMALGLFAHNGVARHPGDLGMKRIADLILDGIAAWERGRPIDVSVAGASRATLSFRAQSPKEENPTYAFLAEYGSFKEEGTFRVTFNGRRERRVCGFYGDVRVYSPPNALDDGLVHHVALDIEPGRMMTLFLDGRVVDSAPVPAHGFAAGPLSIARRAANRPLYWMHFRGLVDDVSLKPAAFDPDKVAGGVAPRSQALALPPDPFAATPTWERPKTTRRYLHGPFAERMLTFWREGKIVFGEVEHKDDWSLEYKSDVHAHAAWLVHGGRDMPLDFRAAEMRLPPGGEPDHAQAWRIGPLEVELAACAPFGRRPSAHVRLAVRNLGDKTVKEPFAFLLREGLESRLVFGAPDVYRIFRPSLSDWDGIPPDGWRREGDVFLHGDRFAAFSGAQFDWDAAKGAVRFALSLAPGGTKEVEMELGRGARQGFGYADARSRMYADWTAELEKLRIPKTVGENDARIIRNLAVQMLQCLSMPTQGDFVLPRQGGLQRYIWPGDADCFLEALDAIGYGDYVAKAIDFYYSHCQRENGEAGPFKNNWAGDTASVLKTFARHCRVTGDGECWRRWRDAAFRSFGWIQSTRAVGGGLFPAMKATDHPAVLRAWGSNDLKSLEAFDAFAKAAEKFGDPRAGEIAAAARDYRRALAAVMDGWRAKAAGLDEFRVPITAEGDDDALTEAFMFYLHPGRFAEAGLLTEDEMLRLRMWLLRHGYANENGLYANQISTNPECRAHVWYTTWSELQWFRAWRRVGRDDLAKEALDACLRFALTDELYVGERYHDANPWYYPWSPNASGSGRIVSMILESASGATAGWPFIVIRHTGTINASPKVFEQLIDCHRRHRGACDEFWFAAGGRKTPEAVARDCSAFARFRPLCDEVGIALSYQQGLTLGHGEAHDGKAAPGSQQFSDDAWQRGADGNVINFLCPRSPDVVAYEREYAKAVLQASNPASYWLDDDLRLGIYKPHGCFCDRCIAAFNAKTGGSWTRESLTTRLFSKNEREPVRAAWIDFNAESLAVYAAAVRQAADELKSPCRLAYQSVWADTIYTASSYRPLLEALAGPSRRPVGIRPGAGYYTEAEPRGMVKKCLSVAREAERCRDYGNLVASVCYEQETYPRHVLHKSPGAIMTECALALASGCNSLSLYWYSQSAPEPVEEYDRFLKTLSEARPYFERLAASTRRTRLGGVARFVGSAVAETPDYDLRDQVDFDLACAGIPVTVMESGAKVWYVTDKSRREMTETDKTVLEKGAVVDVSDVGKYPLASRRTKLLDELDAATGGMFPVRIDACRPLRILPRVREDGTLDSVTILNLSIGDTDAFTVRVRRPVSRDGVSLSAKGEARPFHLAPGATDDEGLVEIPNLPGWHVVTLFFAES